MTHKSQALAVLLFAVACRVELGAPSERDEASTGGEVWVYTSMYREVVSALEPLCARSLPGIRVRFFQAGSEKVRARLEAELAAGSTRCDLLMISDPAAYLSLAERDLLAARVPPAALRSPRALVDIDGRFAVSRVSTMVIGVNPRALAGAAPPSGFADLLREDLRGKVTMGDPLSSGTALSTVALVADKLGWRYFEALRDSGLTASGGNAAVLSRLESREAAVGILLYENIVQARRRGSPVAAVFPAEGAVLIPGHIAILRRAWRSVAAQQVEDFLLGPRAQQVIVQSGMHGADPSALPPDGAPPLDRLLSTGLLPSGPSLQRLSRQDAALRERWSRLTSR